MKRCSSWLAALALVLTAACRSLPDYSRPLPEGAPALLPLGPGRPLPDVSGQWAQRDDLLPALDRSIQWMHRPDARASFPAAGISYERALSSLERFREILVSSTGPADFQQAVAREFTFYESAGWDGRGGGVLFTGYCTPILAGSREKTPEYRYPLYSLPTDLVKAKDGTTLGWDTSAGRLPYPSRRAIEASHMLASKGLELVWLHDPIDAYLAHVNGSAFVKLRDGSMLRLGYAGKNGREYTSLGRELENDGAIPRGQASLATIRAWAARTPEDQVLDVLQRNASYVFFTPIDGNPHGSLDFEVTANRSLATDKTLFPRAALVLVDAGQPGAPDRIDALMLDQDTGGAIRTAGRADVYLGIGPEAEVRAGRIKLVGQLYYLFLKE